MEALNNTVNHVKTELLPEVDFAEFDRVHEEHEEAKPVTVDTDLKWD